jgi:glycogen debranching enzyme
MLRRRDLEAEWLEADGRGGFASGTVSGARTRRYHALLLAALRPPVERYVFVNALEVWLRTPSGRFPLSTHQYASGVRAPDGERFLTEFRLDPWPNWHFEFPDGSAIQHEVLVEPRTTRTVLRWRLVSGGAGTLEVRPLLSGRDYHALHRENAHFNFTPRTERGNACVRPYPDLPAVSLLSNGEFIREREWYRDFLLVEERARGLDCTEDLASVGRFEFSLAEPAHLTLALGDALAEPAAQPGHAVWEREQSRRTRHPSAWERRAEAYFVERAGGTSIVAGYPWFTDWGRDTFIALRGLTFTAGRWALAGDILSAWSRELSLGMVPNRFPDAAEAPEFNSADATLWFVLCAHEFLEKSEACGATPPPALRRTLIEATESVLIAYARGTRFGIHLAEDGLLACGEPGLQLTWMDAKVGDWVVTPRIGKPVELQALWLNALAAGRSWNPAWEVRLQRGLRSFRERFWNPLSGGLYDVVDADHVPGRVDASVRPNQIFAAGGLSLCLLASEQARSVVHHVETELVTPLGLRTLARSDPSYHPRYLGSVLERDGAYHQGTVWPWLMGPFVEAWLRVHGNSEPTRKRACERFVAPLLSHVRTHGLGHVSEIADAEPPYTPRGAPFQAWSLGELCRLVALVGCARETGDIVLRTAVPSRRLRSG